MCRVDKARSREGDGLSCQMGEGAGWFFLTGARAGGIVGDTGDGLSMEGQRRRQTWHSMADIAISAW